MLLLSELDHQIVILLLVQLDCANRRSLAGSAHPGLGICLVWTTKPPFISSTWQWKVNMRSAEVEHCLMQPGTSYASVQESQCQEFNQKFQRNRTHVSLQYYKLRNLFQKTLQMSSVSTLYECFLVFQESEQNIFWFLHSPQSWHLWSCSHSQNQSAEGC